LSFICLFTSWEWLLNHCWTSTVLLVAPVLFMAVLHISRHLSVIISPLLWLDVWRIWCIIGFC
jgi:hypothetical protein